MAIFQKRVTFYRCEKCGYEWPQRFPNTPPPTVCANRACKATTWNKPRQKQRGKRMALQRRVAPTGGHIQQTVSDRKVRA